MATQRQQPQTSTKTPDPEQLKKAPKLLELTKRAQGFYGEIAPNFEIGSDEELLYMTELSKKGAVLIREYEEFWDEPRKAAYSSWRIICSAVEAAILPLKTRVSVIDRAVLKFQNAKKVAAEKERLRIQDQAKRDHEEMFLNSAAALEEQGRSGEAEMLLDSAISNPPTIPAPAAAAPMTQGVYVKTNWEYEIFDPAQLPREFLMPDTTKIGKVVRAMKESTNIPGVRAFSTDSLGKRLK